MLRRSTRLNRRYAPIFPSTATIPSYIHRPSLCSCSHHRSSSTPTLVIDLVTDSEEYESSASEEEEVTRTIHTRSRSYPGGNPTQHHNHTTNHTTHIAQEAHRDESSSPRLTRSSSRSRSRSEINEVEAPPTRVTRSRSALSHTPITPPQATNHATTRTRQRNGNSNSNNNSATYTDPEDDSMGRGKRRRKSPTRFGFQTISRPTTPTTSSTTTTTTTTTWSNHNQAHEEDDEEGDDEMENESRYNLRSRGHSVSSPFSFVPSFFLLLPLFLFHVLLSVTTRRVLIEWMVKCPYSLCSIDLSPLPLISISIQLFEAGIVFLLV